MTPRISGGMEDIGERLFRRVRRDRIISLSAASSSSISVCAFDGRVRLFVVIFGQESVTSRVSGSEVNISFETFKVFKACNCHARTGLPFGYFWTRKTHIVSGWF